MVYTGGKNEVGDGRLHPKRVGDEGFVPKTGGRLVHKTGGRWEVETSGQIQELMVHI